MTTAGEKLKAARLKKGLSIEDISKSTKIKPIFLEYIESGQYQKLPSVSYAQGFVKNYAVFLGLDAKEIMAIFRREFDIEKLVKVLPRSFEAEQQYKGHKFKVHLTTLSILALFILLFGFLLFQYRAAFINPSLTIIYPTDNTVVRSSQVTVRGRTDPDTTVYIDKNEVSVDSSGNFSKIINVFPGITTILIQSVNKFQKETQKKITFSVTGS